MYCRNCLKEGKRVNMNVLIEEQAYVCPDCNNKIFWSSLDDNEFKRGKENGK